MLVWKRVLLETLWAQAPFLCSPPLHLMFPNDVPLLRNPLAPHASMYKGTLRPHTEMLISTIHKLFDSLPILSPRNPQAGPSSFRIISLFARAGLIFR